MEDKERDYKDEYKKFQSSDKSKKYRAELNKYNRKKGTYGNGDGKDASHKGGKISGFEKESVNRGRREKSRLKKEQKITESGPKWEVYDNYTGKTIKVVGNAAAATKLMNKLLDSGKVKEPAAKVVREGKLSEMKVNKSKVMKAYTGVINHMRKNMKKLNDDEWYEMTTQLKKWFNKNIM